MFAVRLREMRPQEVSGVRCWGGHDYFGCAGGDDVAAGVAAFGAEVYEVVGGFDNVEVVFDDDERAAGGDEGAEGLEQFVDVVEMEAGGGFVEDVERFRAGAPGQVRGEFDALGFAA